MPADRPARSGRLALLTAGTSLAGFGVLLLLVERRWGPLLAVDDGARDTLHRYALQHHTVVLGLRGVSMLGTFPSYLLVFGVVVVWLLAHRRPGAATFAAVAVVGSSLLNTAVKAAVDRPRPVFVQPVEQAGYSSFPSGHAQGVAVAVGVLLIVLRPAGRSGARGHAARPAPWLVALALGWAVLVGLSRVALGVHYVSDVLAGYLLGLAWLTGCGAVAAAWPRRARPAHPADAMMMQ